METIERVLDIVLQTMWTDCANIFSVVWLRVFFMPRGLTQDVKVMSWRLAKVWVMFGHYIKTTVINPDYVNNEKIYFYFSENLEFIYHNHPGITLLFRYLITHLKERNTWDCGWLEEPSLTMTSREGVLSTQCPALPCIRDPRLALGASSGPLLPQHLF